MPIVTIFKTLDVTNLIRINKKSKYKFNMLMCWCIGEAASQTEKFYILPVENKLMLYDKLSINTVVTTKDNITLVMCLFPVTLRNLIKII